MDWFLILVGIGGVAALVGFFFRWWGLLASAGFACFLAYVWEFDEVGLWYALLVGTVTSAAIVVGSLVRGSLRP